MFNLFRRSKNKTKSAANKNNTKSQHKQNNDKLATPKTEHYRPLSEHERECAVTGLPISQATIEELEDLHDLELNDDDERPSVGQIADKREQRQASKYLKSAGAKSAEGQVKNGNNIYFDDEVNIAKTADNFRANNATAESQITATKTKTTGAFTGTVNIETMKPKGCVPDGKVAAERQAHSAAPNNSATHQYDDDSKLAIAAELSKINKIIAATWHEPIEQLRGGSSRNEQAERQGRVCSSDHKTNNKNNNNNSDVGGSQINNHNNNNSKSNNKCVQSFKNKTAIAQQAAKENVEPAEVTQAAPSVNEKVKYRNRAKTAKNSENVDKKRQSWLGLTLSNVTRNRHREECEKNKESTAPKKEERTEIDDLATSRRNARKSFFLSKSKSVDNDKFLPTQQAAATLNALKGGEAIVNRPNSSLFYNEAEDAKLSGVGERKRVKPLEKSRDFLSEILMARGRNHKRQQQQQQQQQQKQLQEQLEQSIQQPTQQQSSQQLLQPHQQQPLPPFHQQRTQHLLDQNQRQLPQNLSQQPPQAPPHIPTAKNPQQSTQQSMPQPLQQLTHQSTQQQLQKLQQHPLKQVLQHLVAQNQQQQQTNPTLQQLTTQQAALEALEPLQHSQQHLQQQTQQLLQQQALPQEIELPTQPSEQLPQQSEQLPQQSEQPAQQHPLQPPQQQPPQLALAQSQHSTPQYTQSLHQNSEQCSQQTPQQHPQLQPPLHQFQNQSHQSPSVLTDQPNYAVLASFAASASNSSDCNINNNDTNYQMPPLNVNVDLIAGPLLQTTHLETSYDPAASVSTNSYQMTMSNNSSKNLNTNLQADAALSAPVFSSHSVERTSVGTPAAAPDELLAESLLEVVDELVYAALDQLGDEQTKATTKISGELVFSTNDNNAASPAIYCADSCANSEFAANVSLAPSMLNCLTSEQLLNETQYKERNAFSTLAEINTTNFANVQQLPDVNNTVNIESVCREILTPRSITSSTAAKNQLNELTECDRDRWLQRGKVDGGEDLTPQTMGQTNGKQPETPNGSARAATPRREFRESVVVDVTTSNVGVKQTTQKPTVVVPSITVVDCDNKTGDGNPIEQDVFYDFESGPRKNGVGRKRGSESVEEEGLSISAVEEDEVDDNVFHETVDANKWQFVNTTQLRQGHAQLADVREEEEEDIESDDEEQEDDEDEEEEEDDEDDDDEGDDAEAIDADKDAVDEYADAQHMSTKLHNDSAYPRQQLKSCNSDSGIGSDSYSTHAGSPARVLNLDSCDLLNERHADAHHKPISKSASLPPPHPSSPMHSTLATASVNSAQRLPFVRDGNSTDCDETLMQCDDFDFVAAADDEEQMLLPDARLVCIESISLPDVVVESTANSTNNNSSAHSLASSSASSSSDHIININGATGNSIGNVHFIPIHVEGAGAGGDGSAQKRRSQDDSIIGGKKSFGLFNGHAGRSTVEITAEDDKQQQEECSKCSGIQEQNNIADKLKRDLVNQETRYNAQLENAKENAYNLQTKVSEMQTRVENLEKELALKTWNADRLQGELVAAHKDDEYVRKRLKLLEDEKTNLRHKYCDNEEELNRKYEELEEKYKELEEKYKQTRQLASELHTQFAAAQSDAEQCREQLEELRVEMEEQLRILRNALENSEAERKISEDKWQKEFEMLRTQNQDREESLMTDCEWQLRQMQRNCKEKIDKAEHGRREALELTETLECAAQERLRELQQLRPYEAEVKSLRGVVSEQEHSTQTLGEQIEALKNDLQTANENLEDQIEAVRTIKYQCDNKIYDKERELIQRIDDVRNEAAAFWENKLYTEMTRLKSELESVFIEERRDALDKLQAEHIEELRALTTRYTANEEELRAELAEVQERLDQRDSEFMELREKSDNTLLQTRMHLDRADREYQNAMYREEAKREALEESLRKEFEEEKLEMEEKFRERLGQVKDEFATELQLSTQDMVEQHRKELEQQEAKLHADKDKAIQELIERHRKKMAHAAEQMKDIELQHQHDLKDLKATYDADKVALDKRDISNANEIEQLHRKCRCLTNLFEEMRMRYERRDPRHEDLREIAELRSRCESQERDLYLLTDRLREMQIKMEAMAQQNGDSGSSALKKGLKAVKKPPPKTIPTNCDVIYEENEERDSPPPAAKTTTGTASMELAEEEEDSEVEANQEDDSNNEKICIVNGQGFHNNNNNNNKNKSKNLKNNNKKCSDRFNDDDDGHMISAV